MRAGRRTLAALALLGSSACDPEVVVGYADDPTTSEPLPMVSWPSGAHASHDVAPNLAFATWRGRPLDVVNVFVDRTQDWSGIVTPSWPVDMYRDFPGKLIISLPLYPESLGNNRACAAGEYDAEWRKLGAFLVARGRADSILRLGWGPNDLNHAWRAAEDTSEWVTCFRRVVSAVRESNARVLIDWSFNPQGAPNIAHWDPYTAYPGDAYVDVVGIEAFDHYPSVHDDAEWQDKCRAPTGLCSVITFARMHGKKLGIAEWGVTDCGATAGGDNAFFIRRMVTTFAANRDILAYEAYFESAGDEVCSQLMGSKGRERSAAMYRTIYRMP